jgi:hypothetical protein
MKNHGQTFFMIAAGWILWPAALHAQSYSVSGLDVTAGGGVSSNGAYTVNGMIGQLGFRYAFANPAPSNSVITWSKPATISYGTPLGASQLSATANVPGSFAYNPAAGAVLPAGSAQVLTVTFTPANTNNYNGATATVTMSVLAAPLTITANNASKIYGAALPVFTASYAGFVNGNTLANLTTPPSLTTTATASSPAGVYPITGSGAVDLNYLISYVSGTLTVSPFVTPPGDLFSDDFAGTNLSPWTVEEGTWAVANVALNGSSGLDTLGYAYIGTNWTNYTVQASVRFSMTNGPWGAGIGGRLNTATGSHYGAWVYPEGSGGGSSIMNLIKWETWGNWSRIPMAQAKLPGVGTNWHTVALSFQGSSITASYDGTQLIRVTDSNFSSMAPLASGGITADLFTYQKPFVFSVANVVVTLDTNAPVAVGDNYIVTEGAPLSVPAPGILVNDSGGNGSLTALLVSGPANGTLTLNSNGSFLYTPGTNFVGQDSFSYKASDASGDLSAAAVVSLLVTPAGDLFSDDFAGTNLSPWTVEEGTWAVANGELNGSSGLNTLGYAYIGTNWTNYTVQANVRFSMTNGPWGAGIGGRLNTATGAHYAAWVYPEGSGGGSSIMNLIKWETWGNWSRIPMAQAKLPGVGTNWHTVALSFQGSNITASYDGTQEISVTDSNFSSMGPLASGGITADLFTYQKPFVFSVANVVVTLDTNAPAPNEKRSTPRLASATNSKVLDFTSDLEIEQLTVSSGGQVRFVLRGQFGQAYLLEISTDLIHWQVLATGALPSARFVLVDQSSAPSDRRFYRVSKSRE